MMTPRVLIAAGGTGGHVFPALAVAEELRRRGWHAEWVGSDRGLESRVIPAAGIGLHILRFSGLRGKGLGAWLSLPLRLISALGEARAIVARVKPHAVVAFGGYVTFPVGLAASMQQIPLCVHEQNAVMGTANRWLARIAKRVMLSFPNTKHAPRASQLIGNPVRASIAALPEPAARYAERSGALRVLVVGGSLGASALNRALPQAFALAAKAGQALEVRHQTGPKELEEVKARYRDLKLSADCSAFINDMDAAYAWADLIICRAGASTVTEVAAAGVAAVFVPLPSAIDDHQTANARFLASSGAAWLIAQSDRLAEDIATLTASFTRGDLAMRAQAARKLAMHGADAKAADIVGALTGIVAAGEAAR